MFLLSCKKSKVLTCPEARHYTFAGGQKTVENWKWPLVPANLIFMRERFKSGGGVGGLYILFIHQVRSTWMGNHCWRWRDQTSVIKCKQTAVWHVCSLVLFRCLAYSDPLQTLGLCCSLSPAHTLSLALPFSIFLSLSWAAALIPSSPWLLHSSLRICKLFYISLSLPLFQLSLFPRLSFTPSLSQSLSLPFRRCASSVYNHLGPCVLGDDEIWSPMLDDPHLISHVRQILKQVNF